MAKSKLASVTTRLAGCVLTVGLGTVCLAPSAWAVCSSAPAGFIATPPSQLLSKYPNGGGTLVSEIRNLAATTNDGVSTILGLITSANVDQRRAIGAGLGQAAAVCARPDPETARAIQEAILKADNPEVSVAYQAVTGDRETGSVGGGGGGGGGGLGGGGTLGQSTTTGQSDFYANSTTSVLNLITPYNSGVSSVDFADTSTTENSPSTSVSQSR